MSKEYQYFAIPYEAVNQQEPGFAVWYASWSTSPPTQVEPGMPGPMAIGFAEVGKVPANATLLGKATTKTPPPPPPPPALVGDLVGYQVTFDEWQARRRAL